mmetsp:Transcript_26450/g.103058  ORF Transcript_26450/g.103058 Transcript_26450/m.103058 type:complete len:95 (-) Transcript_26450:213-497(-)
MEPVLRLPWNSTTTFVIIGAAIATAGVAALQAQKPKVCEICKGLGAFKCFVCDGSGTIKLPKKRKLEKCQTCNGLGKTRCRPCKGSGYSREYIG